MSKISEIFNFDNIGGKIKNLAKWSCWITIVLILIASPIALFALIGNRRTEELCWIPVVVAIIGPFAVWVSSWMVYAFGEFVEDTHMMRNKYCPPIEEKSDNKVEKKAEPETETQAVCEVEEKTTAEKIIDKNQVFSCPNCKREVKYGTQACECGQSFDWSKM